MRRLALPNLLAQRMAYTIRISGQEIQAVDRVVDPLVNLLLGKVLVLLSRVAQGARLVLSTTRRHSSAARETLYE